MAKVSTEPRVLNKPKLKQEINFILIHLLPLGALFTGATFFDWMLCIGLYVFRMFWITGGYHRYFAHRSYKTSRWFQFVIAFMAQTSAQKGALWWAAHHRVHHRTSDTYDDPHSMKHYGFWYSHVGWIIGPDYKETDYKLIGDFSKYPELVWLNKYYLIPPFILALVVMALGGIVNGGSILEMFSTAGFSALFIGFFLSTVITYHGTFSINSIMHKFGKQRYQSDDESKNSLWLALLTLGEGWHNNHHYYESSARQGFFWWEIDITYYVLRTFAFFGLIWDLRGVPDHIKYSKNKEEAKELAKKAKETAAA
ncbi:MAG: acyl-CoA desaturase [Flammeovirgaceae bacterium]|nr:acyl-CoA desaturase [Flammeovirgaceae bacterium]MBE63443.1 acyl-CoA desaturase [Flammeovirgaceae bacterium]MBR06179.1 acyl-CoA desaturase [Rickettsiales bacterium]HCX20417.1 acyl-CoA desaturase [Cytophagales bacterium]|tara:strand:+ start:5848 stop:6780 length:933 start_codon:yes stop_codon:yes gene_type:complete